MVSVVFGTTTAIHNWFILAFGSAMHDNLLRSQIVEIAARFWGSSSICQMTAHTGERLDLACTKLLKRTGTSALSVLRT